VAGARTMAQAPAPLQTIKINIDGLWSLMRAEIARRGPAMPSSLTPNAGWMSSFHPGKIETNLHNRARP
jgi:hypothetical protein